MESLAPPKRVATVVCVLALAGAGCQVLLGIDPDVAILDAGRDAGRTSEASTGMDARASTGMDARAHDAGSILDTGRSDGSPNDTGTGSHDGSGPWGTLTEVQHKLSHGTDSFAFATPTTAGTLLVAMLPLANKPSGVGWLKLVTDANLDTVYYWPDNPGGLQQFTVSASSTNAVILIELSGAPSAVGLDKTTDTGVAGAAATSIALAGTVPAQVGELQLLYLDTGNATSASVAGWSTIGTDGVTDYAWWRVATATAPMMDADYSPSTPASMLFASLKATE